MLTSVDNIPAADCVDTMLIHTPIRYSHYTWMLVLITWPASVTGAGGGATRLGRGSLVLMDPCIELRTFLILMFPSLYYAHFGWTRFCSFSPNRSSKNKFSQNSMTQNAYWDRNVTGTGYLSCASGGGGYSPVFVRQCLELTISLHTTQDMSHCTLILTLGHGNASVHRVC